MNQHTYTNIHIDNIEAGGVEITARFQSDKDHDCRDHIVIKLGDDVTIFINDIKDARLLRQRLNAELANAITEYDDKLAGVAPVS